MAEMVANCPRCGSREITFDVLYAIFRGQEFHWKNYYEAFCSCRRCLGGTIFVTSIKNRDSEAYFLEGFPLDYAAALNRIVDVEGFISLADMGAEPPPDHVPDQIKNVFREAATCVAVKSWNAAGAMFRATVDLSTRPLLPPEDADNSPARKIRRDLGLRLPWLFQNKLLPEDLRHLSTCIREDGNDGAHEGTLTKEDAEDLRDFTRALLERLFTYPERLRLAEQRRLARRERDD